MPDEEASVQRELTQARQALRDARTGQDAGLSDAAVVNRLYYAAFHAAKAALYDQGHNPASHGGVLSLVGSELVVSGEVSRDQGRFLNHLSELRQQADYEYEAIPDDIADLLTQTEQFVDEMESLCQSGE
jgi:uncharacterized protein (UPF0332 family)